MAKGDKFDVRVGDEIELSFQLNLKRADLQRRNDADQLTHVLVEFAPLGNPPNADIRFEPLSADVTDTGTFEVLPITQDDPKFTRLYRVGVIRGFSGPVSEISVRAAAKLVPKDGGLKASTLPRDPELCQIRVRAPSPA